MNVYADDESFNFDAPPPAPWWTWLLFALSALIAVAAAWWVW
jgi:hypothetical protein